MGRSRSASGPPGMYLEGTALKGVLCNPRIATTADYGADGSPLIDGSKMFCCSPNPNLTSFSADLPNLTNGYQMFRQCSSLTSFTGDLPKLTNGTEMFHSTKLTSWVVDLPSLTNGYYMFYSNALTSFSGSLPKLTDGSYMFYYNRSLTSWVVDIPRLTDGSYMFANCSGLTSWTADIPSLTNGLSMFNYCSQLASFSGDLSSLTDGRYMFSDCISLTSFSATLPNLTDGDRMFYRCILDEASVLNILNSIPTLTDGYHSLHLGKNTNFLDSTDVAAKLRLYGSTVSTPIPSGSSYSCVDDDGNDKGWTIAITT